MYSCDYQEIFDYVAIAYEPAVFAYRIRSITNYVKPSRFRRLVVIPSVMASDEKRHKQTELNGFRTP